MFSRETLNRTQWMKRRGLEAPPKRTQAEGEWEWGDSWETRQELRLMRSEWILRNDKKHKVKRNSNPNSVCIQQHSTNYRCRANLKEQLGWETSAYLFQKWTNPRQIRTAEYNRYTRFNILYITRIHAYTLTSPKENLSCVGPQR